MLRKHYNNKTLSTHRPTQKVGTCQILSAKTKSLDGQLTVILTVNMTNEPPKGQQPVQESSSEMDKLRCITNTELSPVIKITVMGKNSPSREF